MECARSSSEPCGMWRSSTTRATYCPTRWPCRTPATRHGIRPIWKTSSRPTRYRTTNRSCHWPRRARNAPTLFSSRRVSHRQHAAVEPVSQHPRRHFVLRTAERASLVRSVHPRPGSGQDASRRGRILDRVPRSRRARPLLQRGLDPPPVVHAGQRVESRAGTLHRADDRARPGSRGAAVQSRGSAPALAARTIPAGEDPAPVSQSARSMGLDIAEVGAGHAQPAHRRLPALRWLLPARMGPRSAALLSVPDTGSGRTSLRAVLSNLETVVRVWPHLCAHLDRLREPGRTIRRA